MEPRLQSLLQIHLTTMKLHTLECRKRAFRLRLGRGFLEMFNVFFTTKNLQLVYPPLWQGPFNENPCAKLHLGRSKVRTGHVHGLGLLPALEHHVRRVHLHRPGNWKATRHLLRGSPMGGVHKIHILIRDLLKEFLHVFSRFFL